MIAASAALTSVPALAAPAVPAKPAALPLCAYKGPIQSQKHYFLTPFYSGKQADYQGEYAATNPNSGESWCVQPAAEGGYYLLPVSANGSLCLDGSTQNAGTIVQLWNCNGTQTQRWCWNGMGYLQRPAERSLAIRDNITTDKKVTVATLEPGANATRFYTPTIGVLQPSCGS
jgi:hypothetical protein